MHHNQHIADLGVLLEQRGIRHVLISPGSRNAPLIQLFTANKVFICHSIVDERSAGYVALGMARQLQEPVAVVTTSGTAVLNLYPAVAEAYYQHIPLVVLTADRPLESIAQFNNQVIDQEAPFFSHSKGFFQLPFELRTEKDLDNALHFMGQLLEEAMRPLPGPVHINVQLPEPLYEKLPNARAGLSLSKEAPAAHEKNGPLNQAIKQGRVMLLAGMGPYTEKFSTLLSELAKRRQWVIIAENITNLHSDLFIANPELILAAATEPELQKLAPEVVISFGGQVVSKRLKLFLESVSISRHLDLGGDPANAIKEIANQLQAEEVFPPNPYLENWKTIEASVMDRAGDYLRKAPFCNLTVIHQILTKVPAGTVVHLGNSSTIRYAQLLPVRKDLVYYSNRGTSGIDGSLSSAVGAAMASELQHLLLVGDLSFVYDSNALWNRQFPDNLKVVVLNDGGGGIFRLLKGPDQMDFFEDFSVTHHPVSLELLSQAFGRAYQGVHHLKELEEKMAGLFQAHSPPDILEVDTSKSENSRIFKEFIHLNQ